MDNSTSQTLVALKCSETFAALWGQSFTVAGGLVVVGTDGAFKEKPATALELLSVKMPDEGGVATTVFAIATPADANTLALYQHELIENAKSGQTAGALVVIECLDLAGDAFNDGAVTFGIDGRAVVGETAYQDIRPAFGGDGTAVALDAPHLKFIGYHAELSTEAGAIAAALPPAKAPLTPYNEREPDTNGMGAQEPTPAAREIAAFNAAPPVALATLTPAPVAPVTPVAFPSEPVVADGTPENRKKAGKTA